MKKQYVRIAAFISLVLMFAFVLYSWSAYFSYRNSKEEMYKEEIHSYFKNFYDQLYKPLIPDNEYIYTEGMYIFGTDVLLSGLADNSDMGYYGKMYIDYSGNSSVIDMQSVQGYEGNFDINEYHKRQLDYVMSSVYRPYDIRELDNKAEQIFNELSGTTFDYPEYPEAVTFYEKSEDGFQVYEFKWKSDTKQLTYRLRCVFTYDVNRKILDILLPYYRFLLFDWLVIELLFIVAMIIFYQVRVRYEIRQTALTNGVAHDLKTPLAIVKAYAENWGTIKEEERAEYSENLISEVDSMTSIVNNLLYMTRVNSDKSKLTFEKVELMSLIGSVYSKMNMLIEERGLDIDITSEEKDGSYMINADLDMMRVILSNFLSNAIKYSDKKIRISVSEKKGNVVFSITNDGKTINKKDLKKIWDTFYKTDSSRTDRINSHGLGLAINKTLLKVHKAKFGCRSNDTNGTEFWFSMKKMK